jgi:hypothetical protein
MKARGKVVWSLLVLSGWLTMARPVEAYIGPGAGISVLGTAVAFVGAVFFALVGFVWYPLKRLLIAVRNMRAARDERESAQLP